MLEDEIRRTRHGILIVRNLNAILFDPISYAQIHPWREQVEINPFHGKPYLKKIKLRLRGLNMSVYRDKKVRAFDVIAFPFKVLAYILRHWFLFAVIFIALWPVTPHLLIEYSYINQGSQRFMVDCTYFGARGSQRYVEVGGKCPLIAIIDLRKYGKK